MENLNNQENGTDDIETEIDLDGEVDKENLDKPDEIEEFNDIETKDVELALGDETSLVNSIEETVDSSKVETESSGEEKVRFAEIVYEWIDAAVFSLVVIAFIFTFIARQVQVDGPSMQETLHTNERLIMTNFMYTPKKGDIVIVNRYTEPPLIKRVIAVEGDTIAFDDEMFKVVINGVAQEEDYVKGSTRRLQFQGDLNEDGYYKLKKGELFIMGDNRGNSKDSREIGVVNVNDVMGRAVYRFFPLSEAGGLG